MFNTLFLPLKAGWFDKIKSGKKTFEFRACKPYWIVRLTPTVAYFRDGTVLEDKDLKIYTSVRFARGYSGEQITFRIAGCEVVDGSNTDLAINEPVFAIKLGERL